MKPLVSIITLTYNHQDFIGRTIQSVKNQTYNHWEMIIVDDYSTDKTPAIIRNFSNNDKRIRVISHTKNWGIKNLKDSYNQALRLAKGELIAILEGDDFWPNDKLEKQVFVFENKNLVLSYGNWAMTNRSGRTIYIRNYRRLDKDLLANKPLPSILKLFLTLKFDIGSSTVIFRKKPLLEIGGFKNNSFYPFIDIPTYLYLTLKGEFNYMSQLLGYYRRTKNSLWFKFASMSQTMGRKEIKECINNFVKKGVKSLSITLDWQKIEKNQNRFLFKRKVSHFSSVFFNRLLSK